MTLTALVALRFRFQGHTTLLSPMSGENDSAYNFRGIGHPKGPVDAYSIIDKLEWNTLLYCSTAHFERMPDPN
jgi:hypothetical protein